MSAAKQSKEVPSTEARAQAIVSQIAYAQAHGARAVLTELIGSEAPLSDEVRAAVVKAHSSALRTEALCRGLGAMSDEEAPTIMEAFANGEALMLDEVDPPK